MAVISSIILHMNQRIHKLITWNRLALVVSMLVFIGLRLIALDQQYLLHDERDLSLTGYAIAHTGKDFMGVRFPLNFPDTNPNSPPVPYYFNALWWLLGFPLSVFTIRLPYVLFTSLLIPALFDVIFQLTNKKSYAWCTTLVFISSPWIFHITRLGLDSPLALTLTLIAFSLALRRRLVPSLVFFFLAINAYQAYRVVIPIIMLSVPFIQGFPNGLKKHSHQIFMWVVAVFIFSGITIILNGNTISHRAGNELIFTNLDSYSSQIDIDRHAVDVSPFIQSVFINKFTVVLTIVGQRLVDTFSPIFLFWSGDYSVTGSTFSGSFYIILFPFLLVSLIYLFKIEKKLLKIIFVSLVVGCIPVVIHRGDSAIALRGSFMSIGIAILITHGLLSAYYMTRSSTSSIKHMLLITFILVLATNIALSAFTYYVRRPPQIVDYFNENELVLAERLSKKQNEPINIYSHSPYDIFFAYQILHRGINFEYLSPFSQLNPTPLHYENNTYIPCNGHARSFINKSMNIRVIERGCVDDQTAQLIEATINSDNIVYSSGKSGQPIYFIIPANRIIPLRES